MLILHACTPSKRSPVSSQTEISKNHYAQLFKLSYNQTDTFLQILNTQGAVSIAYFWGKSPHVSGYHKINRGNRIVTLSPIFARMLHQLQLSFPIVGVDNISYYPSDLQLPAQTPSLQKNGNLVHEKLISLKPDWVFTYYLAEGDIKNWTRYENSKTHVIFLQNHQEKHPLGRAEWIRPLSYLLGKPQLGDSIFSTIKTAYESQIIQTQNQSNITMMNLPFEGIWYIPPGDSYTDQLLVDAGHNPAWELKKTALSTRIISMEQAVGYLQKSNIWLNVGNVTNRKQMESFDTRLKRFIYNPNLRIFQNDLKLQANGANPYWDLGAVRPDLLLHDLIRIQQGNDLDSLYFYRELPLHQ